jgi:hypothetical protein
MIFTEAEKAVFSFPSPDGSQTYYEDPLSLRRELIVASTGDFDDWLAKVKSGEEIAALPDPTVRKLENLTQATLQAKLIGAARKALGDVPPIDFQTGKGYPDAWILETLQLFLDWIAEKKVTQRPTPTSSPPTA